MATGDNLLTALSVGRECGILDSQKKLYILDITTPTGAGDGSGETFLKLRPAEAVLGRQNMHGAAGDDVPQLLDDTCDTEDLESCWEKVGRKYQLALAGSTFSVLLHQYPDLVESVVCVCDIFARMSPEQKGQLVDLLQSVDYIVAMCGDGANDCGALKAAHAGISLSEAEASIASPFTSQTPDIRCVPVVIEEGRAALVTSFGVFKYMAAYSLTQFFSVLLLYWIGTNLADFQFLYIDLFLITVFAVLFGYQDAADTLIAKPPPNRILSVPSVCSVMFNLTIIATFQIFIFLYVQGEYFFEPFKHAGSVENFYSFQGTCVFWLSVYQYIGIAMVYSKGYPYRKPIYNNAMFCIALVTCTAISVWWTLYPPRPYIVTFLNLKMPPDVEFRLFLIILGIMCFLLCYLCERWVIDYFLVELRDRESSLNYVTTLVRNKCCGKRESPDKYLKYLKDIGNSPLWLRSVLEKKMRQKVGRNGTGTASPPMVWNNYGNYGATSQSSSADEESTLLSSANRKIRLDQQTVL